MHLTLRNLLPLLIALAFSTLPTLSYSASHQLESQSVIENQMLAFRSGAHEKAFKLATPSMQIIFRDVDNFILMVKRGYGPIYAAQSWSFGRSTTKNGKIYHEVLISGPKGREWIALYTMQQLPDGTWRIAGVRLVRGNAANT